MINTDYYFLNINATLHLDLIQFAFSIFLGYNLSKFGNFGKFLLEKIIV